MNTAIEADDTNPDLRRRARAAIERWRDLIVTTLEDGMRSGEIRPVDKDAVASATIATIEGGVMLGKLYGDASQLHAALDHLETYLATLAAPNRTVRR